MRDDAQKAALRANAAAQRANEQLMETRGTLVNDIKPKDVKALVEENGYALESGPKSKPLEVLVDTAADGLCFGLLPKCPVCGGFPCRLPRRVSRGPRRQPLAAPRGPRPGRLRDHVVHGLRVGIHGLLLRVPGPHRARVGGLGGQPAAAWLSTDVSPTRVERR